MKRIGGGRWLLLALLGAAVAGPLAAQGVTTGAVRGTVMNASGQPVAGVTLSLVNTQTGLRTTASRAKAASSTSRTSRRAVRSPWRPGRSAIGRWRSSGIQVSLGQVVTVDLSMGQSAVTLEALTVTEQGESPLLSRARTGASATIGDSLILRLPTLSRNFTDLMSTAPQVNGTSVAGQNNRYNNIQIDGGVNNDLFGLGSTGTPGGQVNERPISLEAVKEYQILIAPFDVREGGFTGGLVNAVTKSGTNEFHGSFFGYGQTQDFARKTVDRGPLGTDVLNTYHEYQYGGTLSGPIIRNRLQFFAAVDLKSRASPFTAYLQGVDSIDKAAFGVTQAQADSVATWAKANLVDPGSAGQITDNTPDHDIFVKLNGQLNARSQLEVSFNHVTASDGSLIRSSSFFGYRSGYELGNAGYRINNTTQTARVRYNVALG